MDCAQGSPLYRGMDRRQLGRARHWGMIPRYRSPFGVTEVLHAALWRTNHSELASIPGVPRRPFLRLMPSASDALHVALGGFGPSGRVVLPAYTCIRVVEAIRSAGWSP